MSLLDHQSKRAYEQACKFIPGGVNSPVRAALSVGRTPLFIKKGLGQYVWDIDDNQFIDYVGSWGSLLLGHAHPEVVSSLKQTAELGLSFGAPTERETELAQELLAAYPSMDMIRFVNSGSEATMSALRLARGATGRELIVKFEGCYHGHSDALLVKAGSGALTMGVPTSAGIPAQTAGTTLVAEYNNIEETCALFSRYGEQIAAVIVEPVAGNMGVVPPREGFLSTLQDLTRAYGSLLIFDEVMTGFRVSFGGAQALYGIEADLTCLGKVIGGGMPMAAYGGRAHIMEHVSPLGSVYQAGTLSGNPLAVDAGLTTLKVLKQTGFYEALEVKADRLATGIRTIGRTCQTPLQVNRQGAMLSVFFTDQEVVNFKTASSSDSKRFAHFYRALLEKGIYLPPSQFEAWFISAALQNEDIETTLNGIEDVLAG